MAIADIISWVFQVYLAIFFARSAYRKVTGFERVRAEFQGWGYPFPGVVTGFLISVWIVCSVAILIPSFVTATAIVLLGFMFVAFLTLAKSGEFTRLIEPARPIAAILVVLAVEFTKVESLNF